MPTPFARAADTAIVWAVSVLLAAVFLIAGVPKLLGMGSVGIEAAAMQSFPPWIRIVVAVAEVGAAIALLIPNTSVVAALILALLTIPATFTQIRSGGSVWIPVIVLVLLLFVAWRRDREEVSAWYKHFQETPHPILREGVIAGAIGATVVALWFLGVDMYAGRPFFTPNSLGRALLSVFGPVPEQQSMFVNVAAYTLFHYAAFIAVGIVASFIILLAGQEPSVLLGFVMLFVIFEVAFHAFVALLEEATPLRTFAWYQVMAGNILAAAAMFWYLWRAHKELREEFSHAMDIDEVAVLERDRAAARAKAQTPAGTYSGPSGSQPWDPGSSS